MNDDYGNLARELSRSFKAFEASMPGEAALEALERALVCVEVLVSSGQSKHANFARQQLYRSACSALDLAKYDLDHADGYAIAIDWQKIGAAFIRLGHPLPGEFVEVLMNRATRIYLTEKVEELRRKSRDTVVHSTGRTAYFAKRSSRAEQKPTDRKAG
ncbi:MAG: hypothetical protein R3316_12390 [Rhodovibrionaceae bacterium]|nr:hypothetical protein [Rhodovibrionaceae bacterium]